MVHQEVCVGNSQIYEAGYSAIVYLRLYYVANTQRRLESCGPIKLRLSEKPRDAEGADGISAMQPFASKFCPLRRLISHSHYTPPLSWLTQVYRSQFYPNCMLSDHTQEDCALTPVPRNGREPMRKRHQRFPEWVGRFPERRRRRRQKQGACFAWNDGRSPLAPYYPFDHVCSKCFGNHRREICRARGSGASKGKPQS